MAEETDDSQDWFFTFGQGHTAPNKYVKIHGTFMVARKEMFRRYGAKWSHQYATDEFETIRHYFPEGELR